MSPVVLIALVAFEAALMYLILMMLGLGNG